MTLFIVIFLIYFDVSGKILFLSFSGVTYLKVKRYKISKNGYNNKEHPQMESSKGYCHCH